MTPTGSDARGHPARVRSRHVMPGAVDGRGRARSYARCALDPGRRRPGRHRAQARGRRGAVPARSATCPRPSTAHLPEQRIVEAAAVLPAYGGVTGWAALRWLGAHWFDGLAPDAAVTRLPGRPGHGTARHPAAAGDPGQRRAPRPDRARPSRRRAADGRRPLGALRDAVRRLDCAQPSWRPTWRWRPTWSRSTSWPRSSAAQSGWTGIPRCREALALANENAGRRGSESLRLVWVLDAGFPPPLCNRPVFDRAGTARRHPGPARRRGRCRRVSTTGRCTWQGSRAGPRRTP